MIIVSRLIDYNQPKSKKRLLYMDTLLSVGLFNGQFALRTRNDKTEKKVNLDYDSMQTSF